MQRPGTGALSFMAALAMVYAVAYAQDPGKPEQKQVRATVDQPVKDFKLADLNYKPKDGDKPDAARVSLSQFKDKKAVVLFFMSETCGTTWRYEKRFGKLLGEYADGKNVAMMGVRCSAADSPESIKKFCETRNFNVHVLNDENGEMTGYFNVRVTPTFVLIDKKGVLRYIGSFDDNPIDAQVTKNYLPDAVKAVLDSKEVAVKQTRAFG